MYARAKSWKSISPVGWPHRNSSRLLFAPLHWHSAVCQHFPSIWFAFFVAGILFLGFHGMQKIKRCSRSHIPYKRVCRNRLIDTDATTAIFGFVSFSSCRMASMPVLDIIYGTMESWENLWWNSVMRTNTCTPLCGFSKIMSGSVPFAWELHLPKAFQQRYAFGKHERDGEDQKKKKTSNYARIFAYGKVKPFFVLFVTLHARIFGIWRTKIKKRGARKYIKYIGSFNENGGRGKQTNAI